MKRFVHKIVTEPNFLSLTGNIALAFFGFASFALLARSFPTNIFGQWVLYLSSGSFIEMFRFGITNTAIIRYLSGASDTDRKHLIGSNGLIGLVATAFISIILWLCYSLFPIPIRDAGYELFFLWYPLLAFLNLPYNTALVVMQADQQFGKILLVKSLNSGLFFLVLVMNYFVLNISLTQIILAQLAINLFTSLLCLVMGWDGLRYIFRASRSASKTLLDFGKYTTFTLIGTNLLRSADTLIISLSPLGTAAVALYSIPLKLTEIQQIPLRSFVATAFPKMSKASINNLPAEVKHLFYVYSGAMTYLFVAICVVTFIFAEQFVLLLGGHQYLGGSIAANTDVTIIVRAFSFYGLLLPLDRMTGIGLDAINRPGINLIKVTYMVIANVVGDLIAVFVFKSLLLVAVASILFTVLGVWVGYYYLDRELQLEFKTIFTSGTEFYQQIFMKLKYKLNKQGVLN